jgi:hypothetical protein
VLLEPPCESLVEGREDIDAAAFCLSDQPTIVGVRMIGAELFAPALNSIGFRVELRLVEVIPNPSEMLSSVVLARYPIGLATDRG